MNQHSATPAPPKRRKISWVLVAIIGVGGYLIYTARDTAHDLEHFQDSNIDHRDETDAQRLSRLRAEAPKILQDACLKAVTGFSRIIETNLSDTAENPNNWTAAPVMEFVNKTGGIERTNLPFLFAVHSGNLFCDPDTGNAKQITE